MLQLLGTLEYRLGGDGVECQMSRCDPNARHSEAGLSFAGKKHCKEHPL